MVVALPRPSGLPNNADNNSENFIDHQLLGAEGILKKIRNFYFCQKMGVALPRPSGWPNIDEKKILKLCIDHILLDGVM